MQQREIDRIQQLWVEARVFEYPPALQIGCGMKRIPEAVNVDPNPDRWAWADAAGDAHRLPFAGGTFNCVVSSHVVPHLRDPLAAFVEMARVLKPGGIVAHVIPDLRYAPRRRETWHPFADQPHGWHGPDDFARTVVHHLTGLFKVVELCNFDRFNWSFKFVAIRL